MYKELPAVYNWTGFYIGGNVGAGWSGLSGTNFSDTIGSTFTAPTNVQFLGGGQVGVNYQFWGGVVIGAEAMFDWLSNSQNAAITATAPDGTPPPSGTINNRWLTTATGRLGYAWDLCSFTARAAAPGLERTILEFQSAEPRPLSPAATTPISAGPPASALSGSGTTGRCGPNTLRRMPDQSYTVARGPTTFGGDVITYGNRNISTMTGPSTTNSAAGDRKNGSPPRIGA